MIPINKLPPPPPIPTEDEEEEEYAQPPNDTFQANIIPEEDENEELYDDCTTISPPLPSPITRSSLPVPPTPDAADKSPSASPIMTRKGG
jgi:hypothetical protein